MIKNQATRLLAEMKEFATFPSAAQRYIRRSLDVGLNRRDAIRCWARGPVEAATVAAQARLYRMLDMIRACIPDDIGLEHTEGLIGPLVTLSAYDLAEGKLTSFAQYRFLYERLLGGTARPWLPSAFCAAASLPYVHPELRRTLLQSLQARDATAAGWSTNEPVFFPVWVEKVPVPVS